MGLYPRSLTGQTGEPYCYHDYHVQFHCGRSFELSFGKCHAPALFYGSRDSTFSTNNPFTDTARNIGALGISFSKAAPANITVFIALSAGVFVWLLIWRTRLGYQIRAFGERLSSQIRWYRTGTNYCDHDADLRGFGRDDVG